MEDSRWVRADDGVESPLFRKEFAAARPVEARIQICGLGYFELYCNGGRVGEDRLVPAWSNYEPRENRRMLYPIHDEMACRVYYLEYDLLPYLVEGSNALGVWLGNGWYNQNRRNVEGEFAYGTPKLWFSLRILQADGTALYVGSDETVKWRQSHIRATNIYYGETHDLRLICDGFSRAGYDDADWKTVLPAPAPRARMMKQECPPDRVIRSIRPTLLLETDGRRLYDCGENITGAVVLRIPAAEGAVVTVTHSEELNADKTGLDFISAGGDEQIQTDSYIAGSREAVAYPRFTWHGFRYFEVTGEAEVLAVEVVHAAVGVTSSFSCSDETLTWLYDAYVRSQLTNIHSGVPSDCPHRERLGYTGDGQITAESAMLCLDVRSLYEKWMGDIADGQDPRTGHVQHTAPFYGGGGGPGGWGSAVYRIPMAYYRHYGDETLLRAYYPNMRLWLDYMESRAQDGLVVREEEGGWCLGDWCTPEPPALPEPFVNTYYYLKGLREVAEAAGILGIAEEADAAALRQRAERCVAALRRAYRDEETGGFCAGVNGADAFALDGGFGDERSLRLLVEKYGRERALDTGIFGTDVLIDVLFRYGEGDLALSLLTAPTAFAHMRESGATTLWEHWKGGGSHNHPMFGGVVRALFRYVLGIRQAEGSAGFERVSVDPAVLAGLDWAKGHIETPRGKLAVSYRKDERGELQVNATIE